MAENSIEIKNLYKKYKNSDEFSVNDISLNIDKNEIYGILGPNGAGKTTLISMLSGLIKPTSGQFKINGLSPQKDSFKLKQIIGIVPQEYALYPTLTAKENLMFFGSLYGLKHKNLHKSIDESLEIMGLSKFADKKVDQFSGGMKRRCNLIAGTLHQPKVLFLDEPTVGVDVQSKKVIIDYLKELNNSGTCIIYTSHHLSEAEEFCTKIAIIDKGKIHAAGTPEELIAQIAHAENLEDVFISLTGKELRDVV
ncbi:ABC-2 type transport system ATP-binding protein [Chryseobacterium defluvii]|uniref:ABC-2 type transport system ATP-binding protein n=1 Tax=Chryseobacterium defluvii TaxID=160396 RepID=A0A840KK71_9FLAO|nr:ABC transporter ATP-binding protein [Chryseobacterium defluvii]MBB4808064.1 ABC-2 type transport system ATP-binding protein [Chryseobacterium defluvii]